MRELSAVGIVTVRVVKMYHFLTFLFKHPQKNYVDNFVSYKLVIWFM
jgi:hypothetical protein